MPIYRTYGKKPFTIAVIHGGPGAAGSMAPVAKKLSSISRGVLEPLQTKKSVEGQIQELKTILQKYAHLPVTLIGHSWGAWLIVMLAAQYPMVAHKLILIGSGPFTEKYVPEIMQTRISRLSDKKKKELKKLQTVLNHSQNKNTNILFTRLGKIFQISDSYNTISQRKKSEEFRYDIFTAVWPQAESLRKSGKLLQLAKKIRCPLVALHGDYDPHPYQGVQQPLSRIFKKCKFILLKNCGHEPWQEREARDTFFQILQKEVA